MMGNRWFKMLPLLIAVSQPVANASAADRSPASEKYSVEVGIITEKGIVLYASSSCDRGEKCSVQLKADLSVNVSFRNNEYTVRLLDLSTNENDCCFFEFADYELIIKPGVKYTVSNLRYRRRDSFVFPGPYPGSTYGKFYIKLAET